MNLFFSKLFGKLLTTEKFEQRIADAAERTVRYRQVEQSAELKEYQMLHTEVTSQEFQQKKQQYIRTKYKNTSVYQTLTELTKLKKNKTLHLFLEVKESNLLLEYLQFRSSADYIKLSDKALVKASDDLKRMRDFEKSKAYKTYLALKDSTLPARYEQLQKETADEAFQRENQFWANPSRWQTTEEYKQELRYLQLADNPDIQFFLQQDEQEIKRYEAYENTFDDEFDWKHLADSAWRAGFSYQNKALKRVHSFTTEQQANNGGKNTGVINGTLTLVTQQETVTASAWDEKKGFVNKEFAYTSDVVTTADTFRQEEGLFMAKVRCTGAVNHVVWLGADKKLPLVKLFHFNGKKLWVGNTAATGFTGASISGICPADYYVYSLQWNKNELVWYVNNLEVYRTTVAVPHEALYIAFSSFITAAQHPVESKLEVDWLRVYTKK